MHVQLKLNKQSRCITLLLKGTLLIVLLSRADKTYSITANPAEETEIIKIIKSDNGANSHDIYMSILSYEPCKAHF